MEKAKAKTYAFHALVSGRVQGVGYRYTAVDAARMLGLVGWVRNTDEGDVEVQAEGPKAALDELAAWLHEGPPGAHVSSVKIRPIAPSGRFKGFSVEF